MTTNIHLLAVPIWYLISIGLATVNHIKCTYGNCIMVPVTVPVATMGACGCTWYMDSRWPSKRTSQSLLSWTIYAQIVNYCTTAFNTTVILTFTPEGKFYSMIQAMISHRNRQTRGVLKITTGRFWKLQSSSVVGWPTGTIFWCIPICSGHLHYTWWAHQYCLQYYTLIPSKESAVAVEWIFSGRRDTTCGCGPLLCMAGILVPFGNW